MAFITAVVLAAGEGKRMKNGSAKVLAPVLGTPMLTHVLRAAGFADCRVVVAGHRYDDVAAAVGNSAELTRQEEQKGTAHAVLTAAQILQKNGGATLVLAGDMPLVTQETLKSLVSKVEAGAAAAVACCTALDPTGYGRIIRGENGDIKLIVEQKDADAKQRAIKEINTSIYCFDTACLLDALSRVKNENAQGEYYLTDCIGILSAQGKSVAGVSIDALEGLGVNDPAQLDEANRAMRRRVNKALMLSGVTMLDSETTYISAESEIEPGVTVYPGNVIEGETVIKAGTVLYAGNYIEGAKIGANCKIGPSAHIRPKVKTGDGCRVGNFVELKNLTLGDGSKVSHLTYCGDGEIGKKTNVGCGVVFSNYDGKNKFRTTVGDNAFIGCNANLVAPVTVEDGAYIAAGSTITKDVPSKALGIARERQTNIEGWTERTKNRR